MLQKIESEIHRHGYYHACQGCGSDQILSIIDLGRQPLCDTLPDYPGQPCNTYPLHLVRCGDCGLVQLDYAVNPQELFHKNYPYRSGITPALIAGFRETARIISERCQLKPYDSLVVDIGSNDGTLLSGFSTRVLGVEPTDIAEIANQNSIKTLQAFFNLDLAQHIVASYGPADVILATNVFAHINALKSFMRGVDVLLKPDGMFITESHYLVDIIDKLQYDSIYHEHLRYYSLVPMAHLLFKYGFQIVDVDRIPNYGGSIRVYAKKTTNTWSFSDAVVEMINRERAVSPFLESTFTNFATAIRNSRGDLQQFFITHGPIPGIGCPGRAVTLLNYARITSTQMPYIAEQSSSLKLGKYLPRMGIPIIDERRLFEQQPEYAMLLSWHYADSIIPILRRKGLKSKIVVPLPVIGIDEP